MKLLVALDQSKGAQVVLEKAVELAKAQGSEVTLMVVAETFKDAGYGFETGDLSEKILEGAKAAAKKAKEKAEKLGVKAKIVVESGVSPADNIVKYAAEKKMDLIVLGSRAKKGLDRFLIGSVASKVAAHAHCSVMVVR